MYIWCTFHFCLVAWFTFDPILSGPGLQYSEDSTTVTGEGWEHRIALGSVGFSRGVHYWEFTIDKYDADTDPAFGIARIDVARDKMLGRCLIQLKESKYSLTKKTEPLFWMIAF